MIPCHRRTADQPPHRPLPRSGGTDPGPPPPGHPAATPGGCRSPGAAAPRTRTTGHVRRCRPSSRPRWTNAGHLEQVTSPIGGAPSGTAIPDADPDQLLGAGGSYGGNFTRSEHSREFRSVWGFHALDSRCGVITAPGTPPGPTAQKAMKDDVAEQETPTAARATPRPPGRGHGQRRGPHRNRRAGRHRISHRRIPVHTRFRRPIAP